MLTPDTGGGGGIFLCGGGVFGLDGTGGGFFDFGGGGDPCPAIATGFSPGIIAIPLVSGTESESFTGFDPGTFIASPHAGQMDSVPLDSAGASMRWEQWGHSNLGI